MIGKDDSQTSSDCADTPMSSKGSKADAFRSNIGEKKRREYEKKKEKRRQKRAEQRTLSSEDNEEEEQDAEVKDSVSLRPLPAGESILTILRLWD